MDAKGKKEKRRKMIRDSNRTTAREVSKAARVERWQVWAERLGISPLSKLKKSQNSANNLRWMKVSHTAIFSYLDYYFFVVNFHI